MSFAHNTIRQPILHPYAKHILANELIIEFKPNMIILAKTFDGNQILRITHDYQSE